jgi:hypothetical protein
MLVLITICSPYPTVSGESVWARRAAPMTTAG